MAARSKPTEHAKGWGLRVGGPAPYLAWEVFSRRKADAEKEISEPYHRAVKVVMVPLAEYRALVRALGRTQKEK